MRHSETATNPTESMIKPDMVVIASRDSITKTTCVSSLKPSTNSNQQQPSKTQRSSYTSVFAKIKPKAFQSLVEPRKSASVRSATTSPPEPSALTIETPIPDTEANKKLTTLAVDVQAGFAARVPPVLVEDCTGGVYLLRTRTHRLAAVFKPADEEPYAPNNPKKFRPDQSPRSEGSNSPPRLSAGVRDGIRPGQAAIREVAAYLLDRDGFAGVPATAMATASHPAFCYTNGAKQPKRGSFQTYLPHKCTADDLSVSFFSPTNVHTIAVLDIRLANQDRHAGNLLVVEDKPRLLRSTASSRPYRLVPIDHGACLPVLTALNETSFTWLYWPQAKRPFDAPTLECIRSLDAFEDQKHLEDVIGDCELEYRAMLTLHITTALLQVCALDWNMTASEIGGIMCRQGTYRQRVLPPSVLELLVGKTMRDVPVCEVTTDSEDEMKRQATTDLVSSFRRHLTDHLQATRS